ncbi:von Willebrand factor type A domain-containing protein [Xylaria arbuscula]|nr:von Willebrand factor type A domain-containing protein [Xylaria arbuscula]
MSSNRHSSPLCGCWYTLAGPRNPYYSLQPQRAWLPQRGMKTHTVIKDVTSRTVLTQIFSNDSNEQLKNIAYSFPLYDGVSVVSFTATIGDVKIHGVVKEKQQARREYREAVDKGSKAGLLEQVHESSDTFVTSIGNVPAGSKVIIEVNYVGELKHDAQHNGIRFTIPSSIAPRYGPTPSDMATAPTLHKTTDAIEVVVDFESPEGCPIQHLISPSHFIAVGIGRTSTMGPTVHMANRGYATLSLDTTVLDKDFVFIASIKDGDNPKALLETHPNIPNQRALMATLVPRFNITPSYGEIVFIVDRSGSMGGKIDLVIKAMTILLKSLPVGVKFNICSFGSHHAFLWPESKSYNDTSLNSAINHVSAFHADFGGTEMYRPVQATISQRFTDMPLDAIVLTDGQIWELAPLLQLIRNATVNSNCRFFSLGIGSGASTALVEGIATAGNGFSQFVAEGEQMDTKMVRLLKGALVPHINDYRLEVKYKHDDFEMIDSVREASKVRIEMPATITSKNAPKPSISFFNEEIGLDKDSAMTSDGTNSDRFAHLPVISSPSVIQAPYQIPPLYSFSRTTVYMLLGPETYDKTPEALVLRATCSDGPLELEIKVEDVGKGETIHQLAAKKAVSELETSGGWLSTATDKADGTLLKNKHPGRWDEIVEREAVRLGVKYQIAGRWTSFVALEGSAEHETVVVGGTKPLISFDPTIESQDANFDFDMGASAMLAIPQQQFQFQPPSATPPGGQHTRYRRVSSSPSFRPSNMFKQARSAMGSAASAIFSKRNNGEGGVEEAAEVSPYMECKKTRRPRRLASREDSDHPPKRVLHRLARAASGRSMESGVSFECLQSPSEMQAPINANVDRSVALREVVRMQKSDGSWDWSAALLTLLGVILDPRKQDAVVVTALAVAFLQKHGARDAETWELIVQKAKNWLAQQQGVDVDKEISDAEKIIETATPDWSR